jgi:putative DNA primase/helicase
MDGFAGRADSEMGSAGARPPDDLRTRFQITVVGNDDGVLCKRLELVDGKVVKYPAAHLTRGTGRRVIMPETGPGGAAQRLGDVIDELCAHEALVLGTVVSTDRNDVRIVLDGREDVMAGSVARTRNHFAYQPGHPAWFLLDFDRGQMPPEVGARLGALRGFVEALSRVAPCVADLATVWRASTTAGICRVDNVEEFPAGGEHLFAIAANGSEIPAINEALHLRLWLAGMGWIALSRAGSLLVRSLVDTAVGSPERLVFEAPPILGPGLEQDADRRRPVWREGRMVQLADVVLSAAERTEAERLIDEAKLQIKPHAERVHRAWAKEKIDEMAERGVSEEEARRTVLALAERRILRPAAIPEFDEHGIVAVGKVLLDPGRFDHATLADPIEGRQYGLGKAKIFHNRDTGATIISSFAHGGCVYFLRHDLDTILEKLSAIPSGQEHRAADIVLDLIEQADLEPHQRETVLRRAAKVSGCSKKSLEQSLRARQAGRTTAEGGQPKLSADTPSHVARLVLHRTFADGEHLLRSNKQFWRYTGTHWVAMEEDGIGRVLMDCIEAEVAGDQSHSAVLGSAMAIVTKLVADPNDRDPMRLLADPPSVVNCHNGELWVLDDGSVKLRPHDPTSRLRYCLEVNYDPTSKAPLYERAVREIFSRAKEPEEMVRHFEELAGYCLQPRRFIKFFAILEGKGNDGKSSLLGVITSLMGADAVLSTRVDRMGEDSFATGDLISKLVLIDDDVTKGAVLPDGLLKAISEEKPMHGNIKYGPRQAFVARVVPILATNNPIGTRDLSEALRDRAHLVPMSRQFGRDERDVDLWRRIKATELSGVLNRFLAGLQRVMQRKQFDEPEECVTAKAAWLSRSNSLAAFIATVTVPAPATWRTPPAVRQSRLWDLYIHWAAHEQIAPQHRLQRQHFLASWSSWDTREQCVTATTWCVGSGCTRSSSTSRPPIGTLTIACGMSCIGSRARSRRTC